MGNKNKPPNPTPADATRSDHRQLNFWLWAFLRDAELYLEASRATYIAFKRMMNVDFDKVQAHRELLDSCKWEGDLAKYHFMMTAGMLARNLKRSQHLFPAIQPAYSKANHLIKEGKSLRDLIEHSDEYDAGRGDNPGAYVRENSPKPGMSASANSTFVDENGHWLGGRFCVERAVQEVIAIYQIAKAIPFPNKD